MLEVFDGTTTVAGKSTRGIFTLKFAFIGWAAAAVDPLLSHPEYVTYDNCTCIVTAVVCARADWLFSS